MQKVLRFFSSKGFKGTPIFSTFSVAKVSNYCMRSVEDQRFVGSVQNIKRRKLDCWLISENRNQVYEFKRPVFSVIGSTVGMIRLTRCEGTRILSLLLGTAAFRSILRFCRSLFVCLFVSLFV